MKETKESADNDDPWGPGLRARSVEVDDTRNLRDNMFTVRAAVQSNVTCVTKSRSTPRPSGARVAPAKPSAALVRPKGAAQAVTIMGEFRQFVKKISRIVAILYARAHCLVLPSVTDPCECARQLQVQLFLRKRPSRHKVSIKAQFRCVYSNF